MTRFQSRATAIAICAAIALPLLAAEKLGAKTGLWETTTTMNVGGAAMPAMPAMPAIPPDVLEKLPPAQRAQLEKAMNPGAAKPMTARSCITEKDLAEGAFRGQQRQDMKCTYTVASSTPKHQEITFQCATASGPADGKVVVDVVDDGHVKGTTQVKTQGASVESKFESKWLGTDCGATK